MLLPGHHGRRLHHQFPTDLLPRDNRLYLTSVLLRVPRAKVLHEGVPRIHVKECALILPPLRACRVVLRPRSRGNKHRDFLSQLVTHEVAVGAVRPSAVLRVLALRLLLPIVRVLSLAFRTFVAS